MMNVVFKSVFMLCEFWHKKIIDKLLTVSMNSDIYCDIFYGKKRYIIYIYIYIYIYYKIYIMFHTMESHKVKITELFLLFALFT